MSLTIVSRLRAWWMALAILGVALGAAGCRNTSTRQLTTGPGQFKDAEYVDILQRGDLVDVKFSGNPTPPADVSERIKDDGTIALPLVGSVQAAGLTSGQLQTKIKELYVPNMYRQLTVTVRTENRFFYVDGEVRQGGRLVYSGQITVLKAIAAAGGFTDFAARKRIQLVRANGEQYRINGNDAQEDVSQDLQVIPGDRIYVPRRSPFGGGSR